MNGRHCTLLLLLAGFALTALDVPPPTSAADGWMRADVQARLPATVVLTAAPRATRGTVAFEVLPGRSCELALVSLEPAYRVRLNGEAVPIEEVPSACGAARVHRIEVRT